MMLSAVVTASSVEAALSIAFEAFDLAVRKCGGRGNFPGASDREWQAQELEAHPEVELDLEEIEGGYEALPLAA